MGGLQHALKYFSGVGLIVPQHANPADYYGKWLPSLIALSLAHVHLLFQSCDTHTSSVSLRLAFVLCLALVLSVALPSSQHTADAINQDFVADAEKGNEVQRYVTAYEQSSERAAVISLVEKDKAASKKAPAEVCVRVVYVRVCLCVSVCHTNHSVKITSSG